MRKIIGYYYGLSSPWTYLGGPRLEAIAQRQGAAIAYKPCDFAQVFAQSGGLPVAKRAPQRQAYRLVELERWSRHLDMPLVLQPAHFPTPGARAGLMVIAAQKAGPGAGALSNAIMAALWAENEDIEDPETLLRAAAGCGLDGDALLVEAGQAEAAATLQANTEEAMTRHVFGAPTYAVNEEIFWGQDRLDFVERALAAG
ncbi:MAG: 2-hydroxychromene-2-carboxylate isomerase [Alphaproteobacteria bacterium]|nr:2-hydroxychromene-2-carboxylate isomerase [Alphaproteobacteria bacterium]HJP21450.1 2-hydroxychromene-2-carboxylate isomerase [Alphaproteobacteria bacterium]